MTQEALRCLLCAQTSTMNEKERGVRIERERGGGRFSLKSSKQENAEGQKMTLSRPTWMDECHEAKNKVQYV